MKIKGAVLFVLIAIIVQFSFSQSEFLKRGQNGFSGGAGFSVNSEVTGMNVYAGFSYKGYLNADLQYSKADGGNAKDGVLTPSITYYPIKQEDGKRTPALGISVGYCQYNSKTISTISVPGPNLQGKDTMLVSESKIYALKCGVIAHHRIGSWQMFFFQPLLSGAFLMNYKKWEFTVRGGVAIGSKIKHGPLIVVTPGIERQSGLTTFSITLGTVF